VLLLLLQDGGIRALVLDKEDCDQPLVVLVLLHLRDKGDSEGGWLRLPSLTASRLSKTFWLWPAALGGSASAVAAPSSGQSIWMAAVQRGWLVHLVPGAVEDSLGHLATCAKQV
jgi:hypothetical protein